MYIGIEFCCEVEGEVGFGEIWWKLGLVVVVYVVSVFEMGMEALYDERALLLSFLSISIFVYVSQQ